MITLAEAKAYLQLTSSTYDTLIQSYIDYITDEVEAYLSNIITPVTTITNEAILILDEEGEYSAKAFPIRNVTVKKDGTALVSEEDYYLDAEAGTVYFNDRLEKGTDNYTIDYTCGYAVADVPGALKMVALKALKALFDSNKASSATGGGAGDVKSKKIGDFSVSYGGQGNENSQYAIIKTVIGENLHILNKYMRVILF